MSKSSATTALQGPQTGVATLDFGSSASDTGDMHTTTVVTGLPSITAASVVSVHVRIEATSDHSPDELLIDPVRVTVRDIVAGVGFTIEGRMFNSRAQGTYTVNWILF